MDLNVRAFRTVKTALEDTPASKHGEAARKGGLKGGVARAKSLTKERRREIAVNASKARWKQGAGA